MTDWVADEAIPTPSQLSTILELTKYAEHAVLAEWHGIVDRRIFEVVPKWHQFEKPIKIPSITTLGMYALWPRYQGVLRRLSLLTCKEQEEFLNWATDEFFPKHPTQ